MFEHRPIRLLVFSLIVILIGGLVEIVPTMLIKSNVPTISSVTPYTPLELEGRDVYIKEGCNSCHSQMVRPFRSETERYGEYAKAGEFVYDHPFLWGSKRTGPDLLRVGGKYSNAWHYQHFLEPTTISPGSIMPGYRWLFEKNIDLETTPKKIAAMRTLGVPYPESTVEKAAELVMAQGQVIVDDLKANDMEVEPTAEVVALIAYLQRLGTDIQIKNANE
jgi:cytochrome c oxidase cbb3-type subunit I/II